MSGPVDVLAAIDAAIEQDGRKFSETRIALHSARAAIAELLATGSELSSRSNGIRGTYRSGHKCSTDAMNRFSSAHGQFAAALARVKGESQ